MGYRCSLSYARLTEGQRVRDSNKETVLSFSRVWVKHEREGGGRAGERKREREGERERGREGERERGMGEKVQGQAGWRRGDLIGEQKESKRRVDECK
jgi:hypothetical protein